MGWLSAASICVLWPTVQDYYFAELACGAKERHPEQSTNRLRRAMATASAICVCFYIVLLGSLGSLLAERPCGAGEGRCALMFPSRTDYKRPLRLQLQTAGFVGCMRVLYVHVACWWGCVVMVVLAQSAMAMAILCDIMVHTTKPNPKNGLSQINFPYTSAFTKLNPSQWRDTLYLGFDEPGF